MSDTKGDLNGDSKLTIDDALIAFNLVTQIRIDSDQVYINSKIDVNGDNRVGVEELIYILKQLQ